MKRKTKKRSKLQRQTSADPVTEYARDVINKRIVAGRFVRLACERHLADLARDDLIWQPGTEDEPGTANFVIGFFRKVLRLNGGQFEGLEFNPSPWEQFILGSLFGWKLPNGLRRYQIAYCEIAKSNGKSPLAAGVGCFMLVADGEARAEVYAAATKKDQAMILFRDAVAMRDQSPHLSARLSKSGIGEKCWNLADHQTGSWFRPISSDDDSQSGPRPHCALVDELHEHKTSVVVDMMRAGFKWCRQPLLFEITNSGFDRHSVCYQHHEYSIKILERVLTNDSWFSYIAALDEGYDYRDESVWIKANPNLGISVSVDYLRNRVREAQAMPAVENIVRRLNFCEWTEQSERAIQMDVWDQGAALIDIGALKNEGQRSGSRFRAKSDFQGEYFWSLPESNDGQPPQ